MEKKSGEVSAHVTKYNTMEQKDIAPSFDQVIDHNKRILSSYTTFTNICIPRAVCSEHHLQSPALPSTNIQNGIMFIGKVGIGFPQLEPTICIYL